MARWMMATLRVGVWTTMTRTDDNAVDTNTTNSDAIDDDAVDNGLWHDKTRDNGCLDDGDGMGNDVDMKEFNIDDDTAENKPVDHIGTYEIVPSVVSVYSHSPTRPIQYPLYCCPFLLIDHCSSCLLTQIL
jgi:hypothetical protein